MAFRRNIALGYSSYWRKNRSSVESQELVKVILALQKAARHIATNLKPIEWTVNPGINPGSIGIDLNLAKGTYPIPPGKMDLLVGITAREAFHCKILTDVVWLKLVKKISEIFPEKQYLLALLVGIGEDIFTREVARNTVWNYYLPFCWSYVRPPLKSDVTKPPSIATLLYIFADYLFLDKLAVNMNSGYYDIFQKLLNMRDSIIESAKESSISGRCNLRVELYLNLWTELEEAALEWEPESSPEDLGLIEQNPSPPEDEDDFLPNENEESESPDARERQANEAEQKLLETIKESLELNNEKSVNQQIEELAEDDHNRIVGTSYGKATLPCRIKSDPALVSRLRHIFQIQRSFRSRRYCYNRGLVLGKIDGRRLFRHAIDGRFFRKKEYFYNDNTMNIAILVDGSASMSGGLPGGGKEWAKTERLFVSLFEAVKGTGNRLDIFSYYERAGVCEVNMLAHHNRLFTVRPTGRTPTGQAIIATAMKLPKDKRRLIIHLTDGEPNCGISVQKGLEFCDKAGVDVVTIGTYYDDQTKIALKNQYQDRAILVDSLDLFPARLEEVLKARLLK